MNEHAKQLADGEAYWIRDNNSPYFRCSKCNGNNMWPSAYCPNCGGKMNGIWRD